MSRSHKAIYLVAGLIVGILGLCVLFSFESLHRTREIREARQHTEIVIASANSLLSEMKDAETGMRGYLLTRRGDFLEPYLLVYAKISAHLESLHQLVLTKTSNRQLQHLIPLVRFKLAHLAEAVALGQSGDFAHAADFVSRGEGKRAMDAIRAEIVKFVEIESQQYHDLDDAYTTSFRQLQLAMIAASVFSVMCALLFAYFLYRSSQQMSAERLHEETQRFLAHQQAASEQLAQANAELRSSEEKLTVTLDSIGDAVLATDTAGCVTLLNPTAERLTGWTKADALGRQANEILRLVVAESREAITAPLMQVLADGISTDLARHSLMVRRDGSERAIDDSCAAIRDLDGRIIGAVLVFRDVTLVREYERQIEEKTEEQQVILDSSPAMIFYRDCENRFLNVNAAFARATGMAKADIIGKTCWDLFPQSLADGLWEADKHVIGSRRPTYKTIEQLETPQGSLYLETDRFPRQDAHGAIVGVIGYSVDVTQRKQIEEAQSVLGQSLRDQQFYNRSLLEASVDALMATDPGGIITDVNKQMEALSGYSREELIGSSVKKYFTDPDRAETAIKRVVAEQRITNFELSTRARDGKETVVSYNASTFYNREGVLQGVFAVAREMTEFKQIEQSLKQKNFELEQATRMKSEFLATMSHELRTPLNAVIGFSEALKDGLVGDLSSTQQEYIGDIYVSGQHLLSLINDILDLSKVEAGMMRLELEATDLQGLFANTMMIVKEKATNRRIHLDIDIGTNLGVPRLDIRKTKQIIYNLLANAVKFTPEGGRATLRARRVPRSVVGTLPGDWPVRSFRLADGDCEEFVELCVTDTGIGVAEANLEKLFRPFSQIDSSLGRKYEGTGLGLATVKQLAELHGGSVAVASAEGHGSRFAVWLPLISSGDASIGSDQIAAAATPRPTLPADRVALVVQEDVREAQLMQRLLEEEGFTVLRATTAEGALALASQRILSLITLDLQLTGIDGWEFLERLREKSTGARVPVLVFGGNTCSNAVLTWGPAAVLQKPVQRSQLHASLDHLGLHSTSHQSRTVLVVDDDPMAVEVMAAFLPTPAFAVVRAYGGEEAIALARRLHPDLIVLDLMMPQINGFEVVEALQRDSGTKAIPVLVVTAKIVTAEDRAALSPNPDKSIRIVEKAGFDRARFIAEVKRALANEDRTL